MDEVKDEEEDTKIKQDDHRRSGWFDIVMGDTNSDEDDSARKRKYAPQPL